MKRLELCFNESILIRLKSGVKLTKVDERLLVRSKHLIETWQEVANETIRDTSLTFGKFLTEILRNYSKLEINFVHDHSRNIANDVISFKLDFALAVNPVIHPDLVVKELYKDKVYFWKSKKTNILNDPESEPKVLIGDFNLSQTNDLINKLSKKKIRFSRLIKSNSLEYITKLVSSEAGIGVIPSRVVLEF